MTIHNILVPLDGSVVSGGALDFAIERAKINKAEITVAFAINRLSVEIAVATPYAYADPTPIFQALDAEAEAVLDAGESRVKQAGVSSKRVKLEGVPGSVIRDYARTSKADAIVMGTHGRSGFDRFAIGSTTEDVIRSSNVPVFATSQHNSDPHRKGALARMLVAIDGSPAASRALAFACELARAEGARIDICSVIEPSHADGDAMLQTEIDEEATQLLEKSRAQISSRGGIDVEVRLLRGNAVNEILEFAKSSAADLIVMGTHGRAGIPRFILGSVAEGVLRSSSTPVCIMRCAVKSA